MTQHYLTFDSFGNQQEILNEPIENSYPAPVDFDITADTTYRLEGNQVVKVITDSDISIFNKQKELEVALEEAYTKTKKISVINTNSFVLEKTDPSYERFRDIVYTSVNGTSENRFKKVNFWFVSIDEKCKYSITLMNYVWNYVFRASQEQRALNKELEDIYKAKIQILAQEGNLEEMEAMQFNFEFPNGFDVDVNAITQELLNEIITGTTKEGESIQHPQQVIDEMQNFMSSQVDGHIELIKKEAL